MGAGCGPEVAEAVAMMGGGGGGGGGGVVERSRMVVSSFRQLQKRYLAYVGILW